MYIFFDTETTGFPRNWKAPVTDVDNWPRMVQIAWMVYDEMGNKLRDMLISLWTNEPTTIIFVTHDLREAIYLADRIIFLSSAPSRVLMDKKISIRRPRKLDDRKIESLRKSIISRNKQILKGAGTNA